MSEAVGEGTSRDTGQGTYVQWKGVVKLVAKAEAVVSILVTPLSYVCVCVCVSPCSGRQNVLGAGRARRRRFRRPGPCGNGLGATPTDTCMGASQETQNLLRQRHTKHIHETLVFILLVVFFEPTAMWAGKTDEFDKARVLLCELEYLLHTSILNYGHNGWRIPKLFG